MSEKYKYVLLVTPEMQTSVPGHSIEIDEAGWLIIHNKIGDVVCVAQHWLSYVREDYKP